MRKQIRILRFDREEKQQYWQTFIYETDNEEATVAMALDDLNRREKLADAEGNPAKPIKWECSCMQAKCGACAMLINGMPMLACDTKLAMESKVGIELTPLRKFPVVEDLVVDRKEIFDNLGRLQTWLDEKKPVPEEKEEDVLEASRCLQCGCCLEICTSFVPGEAFAGPSAMVSMARLLENLPEGQEERTKTAYREFFYEGCEKYNACHHVCPAGIDIARLMTHSDAAVTAAEMNDKKVSN